MEIDGTTLVQGSGQEPLTVEEVDRIAAEADPFLRNLRITYGYHRLAAVLAQCTPGHANWCTFATWASRQAGQSIRGEDVLELLCDLLDAPPHVAGWFESRWRRVLRRALSGGDGASIRLLACLLDPAGVLRRTSGAVARGNLKVFEEIGRAFARFLPLCAGGPPAPDAVAAFCETLRPGEPPEGQQYLRSAFAHYAQALATPDAVPRAQLMLLANLEIGFHEQTRLQPEIREAIDAPAYGVGELGLRVLRLRFPAVLAWRAAARLPLAYALGACLAPVAALLRRQLRRAVTELLMVLYLPGAGRMHLGRDLAAPPAEVLRDRSHAELLALVQRVEPPAGRPDRPGACDWSSLPERMHYILHLFSAYHQDPQLASAPFTAAQVRALREGRLPDGLL